MPLTFDDEPNLTLHQYLMAAETLPSNVEEINWKSSDFTNVSSLETYLRRIREAFERYFYSQTAWKTPASAIRALRKLKQLPEFLKPSLEIAIRATGLNVILVKVMNDIDLENDPILAERYSTHRWSASIAVELQRYTPLSAYVDQRFDHHQRVNNITDITMLPYFLTLWDELLVPAFGAAGVALEYPHSMDVIYAKICSLCAPKKIPEFVKLENPVLLSVMEETNIYKQILKELDFVIRPLGRQACDHCAGEPMNLRCKRYISVTERDTDQVIGKILHSFDEKHEIPLVYGDNSTPLEGIHINELPSPGIQHHIHARTDLNPKCKRDITIFVNSANDEEVGGVVFGGLTPHFFNIMKSNHQHFRDRAVNVIRGQAFQKLDYGLMAGGGFNDPNGGALGRFYGGSYPSGRLHGPMILSKQIVDSHVKNWFRMALDNALMLRVVTQASRSVGKDIKSAATKAGTLPIGRYGLNQFYCFNYIAPLHYDKDRTFTMSVTTAKNGNPQYYNFCYAKWGIIVYTQGNCEWWFDGKEVHGTVSPSRSALAAVSTDGSYSDGFVVVLREKDAIAAEKMHDAVKRIPYISKYWSS
ncbi:hypothetical protein BDP27DRAFT_1413485 [Rhodocollybia butyracea]|uniref:Uncharacterized protein n=1 Tax=Rhodocollybia butyracea TaxID=206335 RepID=A0A9P5QAM9_9AGAR|nr:hypothetical protein BDP27DRAFT_1413485 [Rhodocollybia butyracea]